MEEITAEVYERLARQAEVSEELLRGSDDMDGIPAEEYEKLVLTAALDIYQQIESQEADDRQSTVLSQWEHVSDLSVIGFDTGVLSTTSCAKPEAHQDTNIAMKTASRSSAESATVAYSEGGLDGWTSCPDGSCQAEDCKTEPCKTEHCQTVEEVAKSIDTIQEDSLAKPTEEVSEREDPVSKKRHRRNAAEKARNAKIDETLKRLKTELAVDSDTTKADTLTLALQSLRKLKAENAYLGKQLHAESGAAHMDAHSALLYCVAQTYPQPEVDIVHDLRFDEDMAGILTNASWGISNASSVPGFGQGTSTGLDLEAQKIVHGPVTLAEDARFQVVDILFLPIVYVAISCQICYCNHFQSMIMCLLGVIYYAFKFLMKATSLQYNDHVKWAIIWGVRVWRTIGYPSQALHQRQQNLPANVVWPRLLMWPFVSLMLTQSVAEHAFFAVWVVLWLMVGTGGASLPMQVEVLLSLAALGAHAAGPRLPWMNRGVEWIRSSTDSVPYVFPLAIMIAMVGLGFAALQLLVSENFATDVLVEVLTGQSAFDIAWMHQSHFSYVEDNVAIQARSDGVMCLCWVLLLFAFKSRKYELLAPVAEPEET